MNINDLPGAELIIPGLEDLQNGKNDTVGALLIAIAPTRLTNAGLTIPKTPLATEPELTLPSSKTNAATPTFTTTPYLLALSVSVMHLNR